MVVSDTSPLNYLILIEHINLLPQLYTRALIPASVHEEKGQHTAYLLPALPANKLS